jgi:hypothetical protein
MLGKAELERLRLQKDLLVMQSDVNRLLLAADWQRLRSPENWLHEAGSLARRHPLWTSALAAAAGVLAVKAVRKPGSLLSGMSGLGKLASTTVSVWKLFRREKSEE